MRKPDRKKVLELGERGYLREPTNRDGPEIVASNRRSRALHRRWVRPPTDSEAFARWMARCRQPNVKCLLVCRPDDEAILGVFILSQIVRGMFHSAYLGYYAEQPYSGQGYMKEGMRLVLRHIFRDMRAASGRGERPAGERRLDRPHQALRIPARGLLPALPEGRRALARSRTVGDDYR